MSLPLSVHIALRLLAIELCRDHGQMGWFTFIFHMITTGYAHE